MDAIASKIKNILTHAFFEKRLDNDSIRVKTVFGRVLEKKEMFPYGFYAKAKQGETIVLCASGNIDAAKILPIANSEGSPSLKEGDCSLYTKGGSFVICREDGTVEVNGKQNGGVIKVDELKKQLDKATARIDGIINALKNSPVLAQDGGAAYKAAIVIALSALIDKENYSDLASEAVFHGTGND